ncbi:hypothetical protein FRX31_006873 [Thalictrum thalictroides]|uniref:Uncharacterized protein n=1 Tax=Thalictrum thalictroides TaxID=46969 RepID=A0A7J6X1C9_THATH|nr:hypothetical protein FRX31_006873 [Thalictrum thalictroides]
MSTNQLQKEYEFLMNSEGKSHHKDVFGSSFDGDLESDLVQDIEEDMAQRYGVEPLELIITRLARLKNQEIPVGNNEAGGVIHNPGNHGGVGIQGGKEKKTAELGNPSSKLGLKRGFLSPVRHDADQTKGIPNPSPSWKHADDPCHEESRKQQAGLTQPDLLVKGDGHTIARVDEPCSKGQDDAGSLFQSGSKAWGDRVNVEEEGNSNPTSERMKLVREVSCMAGTVGASSASSSTNYGGKDATGMGAYGVHSPKKSGSNVDLLKMFGNTTNKGNIQFGSFTVLGHSNATCPKNVQPKQQKGARVWLQKQGHEVCNEGNNSIEATERVINQPSNVGRDEDIPITLNAEATLQLKDVQRSNQGTIGEREGWEVPQRRHTCKARGDEATSQGIEPNLALDTTYEVMNKFSNLEVLSSKEEDQTIVLVDKGLSLGPQEQQDPSTLKDPGGLLE